MKRDWVLKLQKNLYGLKQARYNWFEFLKTGLEKRDFIQSKIDPCVWFRKEMVLVTYVDDCLIFCKEKEQADELIKSLQKDYSLTDEGDVSTYLGVEISKNDDNSIKLSQPHLKRRILEEFQIIFTQQ